MSSADLPEVSDVDLLNGTAAGRSMAFEQLYQRYERRVFNYVRTFVRQPAAAEDVVIDTMMAVWRSAKDFSAQSRVSTWILGIARHKALDAARKAGRQSRAVALDDALDLPDESAGPIETVGDQSRSRLMQRALLCLSDDHQEILRLAFYEDLSYEEIAVLLGIPDNTVKTRVYYAKQRLRQQLKQFGVESTV